MATRFEPGAGLDERIAEGPARRRVEAMTRAAADLARAEAPPAKVWVTSHDERVRASHRDADAQIIPGNLRYVLKRADRGVGTELAREPRDPALNIANRINCRCVSVVLPGVIAAAITHDVSTGGTRVTGRVAVRFPRVIESNSPSSPDTGGGWLPRALRQATRSRAGR